MCGVIVTQMMMVVLVFPRWGLCIAQDECEVSVDRRQHETRRNECAQEQQSKDEQCCPPQIAAAPHPLLHAFNLNRAQPRRNRKNLGNRCTF
jgi:hypothetical protein